MSETTMAKTLHCPLCNQRWESLDEFLADREVSLLGYQLHFRESSSGFFLFNHLVCKTTMGVQAEQFLFLENLPIFDECDRAEGHCPEYCLRTGLSENPPAMCDCSFVQHTIGLIQRWPKR